jgi:hypothetical protein
VYNQKLISAAYPAATLQVSPNVESRKSGIQAIREAVQSFFSPIVWLKFCPHRPLFPQ